MKVFFEQILSKSHREQSFIFDLRSLLKIHSETWSVEDLNKLESKNRQNFQSIYRNSLLDICHYHRTDAIQVCVFSECFSWLSFQLQCSKCSNYFSIFMKTFYKLTVTHSALIFSKKLPTLRTLKRKVFKWSYFALVHTRF